MIVGDINAKVRREHMYKPVVEPNRLHKVNNGNRTSLVNFADSKNCVTSST